MLLVYLFRETLVRRATLGQLLVNEALPESLRDYNRVLDKKGMVSLLQTVATEHPDRYREVSKALADIGREAATESGGNSFGLAHMKKAAAGRKYQQLMQSRLRQILDRDDIDDDRRHELIIRGIGALQNQQADEILAESLAENNPLALQVSSGTRGNKMNLASLRGSDVLYQDHRDHVLPLPIVHSFSQGLSPVEYWANTYGARKGVMATKFATQDAGFLCLARGTQVRMADGSVKAIEDVQRDDLVLGADRYGNTFPVRVSATFDNGAREVWRYRFRIGKSRTGFVTVSATERHKALAKLKRGREGTPHGDKNSILVPTELPLGRCGHGYRLVLPRSFNDRGLVEEPRAGVLGLLLAEGGLTGNNTNFATGDTAVVHAVNRQLIPLGFRTSKRNGKDYEYTIHDDQPIRRLRFGPLRAGTFRCRLRRWLSDLGLLGKLAPDKHMPACVATWDNASVASLLAFLFEGDGWVTETNHGAIPVIGLGMTARHVVETARWLLAWRFGVHAVPVVELECDGRNVFVLQIATREAVERFAAAIKMPGIKGDKLRMLLTSAAPATRSDTEFLYSYVDKEYLGLLPTYDIEVDHSDHLFVLANGAIVSNSKQLNQINHRLVVVDDDYDEPEQQAILRGYPVATADMDNEGALLAQEAGGYPRHTVLTPKILKDLERRGIKNLLIRSPAVGGSSDGGVYAKDVGVRERGSLPGRGEQVGLQAAQALSEPLSQAQLAAKHSGGVVGQEKAVGGFQGINQIVQVPETFRGGATHSEHDGIVQRIEAAPAGGNFVYINDQRHYVPQDVEITVKRGERVEAGDLLSRGMPNPHTITKHKGIGEGRRYFVDAMREAMGHAGLRANRRNLELLARGAINHVRLTDELDEHVADDIVPYSTLEHTHQPRDGHKVATPEQAAGMYLERPVLHYTIGTKLRPSVVQRLRDYNVRDVTVHAEPLAFEPEMIRGMANLQHDPDWQTRMYGSGQKASLLDAVHRGGSSTTLGTSFVPGLAKAVDFGRQGVVRPPEPGQLAKDVKPVPPKSDPFSLDMDAVQPSRPEAPSTSFQLRGIAKLGEAVTDIQAARQLMLRVGQEFGFIKAADNGDTSTGQIDRQPALPATKVNTSRPTATEAGTTPAPSGSIPTGGVISNRGFGAIRQQTMSPTPSQQQSNASQRAGLPPRYSPAKNMLPMFQSPEQLRQYVMGTPAGASLAGPLDEVGAAVRLGTVVDAHAIGALTRGATSRENFDPRALDRFSPAGESQPTETTASPWRAAATTALQAASPAATAWGTYESAKWLRQLQQAPVRTSSAQMATALAKGEPGRVANAVNKTTQVVANAAKRIPGADRVATLATKARIPQAASLGGRAVGFGARVLGRAAGAVEGAANVGYAPLLAAYDASQGNWQEAGKHFYDADYNRAMGQGSYIDNVLEAASSRNFYKNLTGLGEALTSGDTYTGMLEGAAGLVGMDAASRHNRQVKDPAYQRQLQTQISANTQKILTSMTTKAVTAGNAVQDATGDVQPSARWLATYQAQNPQATPEQQRADFLNSVFVGGAADTWQRLRGKPALPRD